MKLPHSKLIFENDKCKLTYDLKAFFSLGFVLSISGKFIILFFGLTLTKKA